MAPGERIKCVLQVQGQQATQGPKLTGPVEVVKHLYAEGGLRSIFRGSAATLLRDGSGSLAYFSVYEGMKRGLTRSGTEVRRPRPARRCLPACVTACARS